LGGDTHQPTESARVAVRRTAEKSQTVQSNLLDAGESNKRGVWTSP